MKNFYLSHPLSWMRTGLRWIRRLFLPAAVLFLFCCAWAAGERIRLLAQNLTLFPLFVAWFIWSFAQWVGPLTTQVLVRALGMPLGYRQLALIHVLRLPAKYLPGGVWQSVARFAAYREVRIGSPQALTILIAEHVLALGTSVALGMSIFAFIGTESLWWLSAAIVMGLALIVVIAFGVKRFASHGKLQLLHSAQAVLSTALFWILAASSFYAYWTAVFGGNIAEAQQVISGYLLSWAAGFAAVFAPQGVGISEWVAAHLLPKSQPADVVMTAVAGFRLVMIAGDLSAWLLALALSHCIRQHSSPTM